MKTCPKCGQEKPISEYYKKGNRVQAFCKPCFDAYLSMRWNARRLKAIEQKGGRCADCGGVYAACVYDFHHLDPAQKEFDWTLGRRVSLRRLEKELEGCVLLCANCHRLRHFRERSSP